MTKLVQALTAKMIRGIRCIINRQFLNSHGDIYEPYHLKKSENYLKLQI